jgi:putative CocE/NonD family hydrolase
MLHRIAALCVLAFPAVPAAAAAQQAPFDFRANYTKQEVMVPMRDGARLFTSIYVPKDTTQRHPFVMMRTPYSSAPYGADAFPPMLDHITLAYARENFIIVRQDVRGRWMSEGEFMDVRPVIEHKTSKKDVDEPSDTYDTIDWLVKNVPFNNGRVGVRGTSYPGFYAEMAALSGHPALKVVSPQAPVTEWMGGDDFFHNGALLLAHSFFFNSFGRPRPHPTSGSQAFAGFGSGADGYAQAMRLGAISNLNRMLYHDSVAFWDSIVAHPMWDAFWAARSGRPHLHDIKPAVLWVGGWFDTENLWGALHAYAAAEKQSPGTENRLVMGPWYHGQWNTPVGDSLGPISWGMATTRFYADSIEIPFFNYYLLDGQSAPRQFEAAVFETGRNVWHFLDQWPPASAVPTSFYLADSGRLAKAVPASRARAFDEYVSDPAKPVPYTDEITQWYDPAFMLGDQRFAARRPDVLVYQTVALDSDLTVAGPIDVDLSVSTTGTDQDFIVKVVDVFPDDYGRGGSFTYAQSRRAVQLGGYEMLIRGDVVRGKYRSDPAHPSHPEPFRPGEPASVKFRMNDVYHTFRAGHRLMVQVQSTWFPMIDRNPGVFENIFLAKDGDFRPTTQRVYRSAGLASRIVLPVLRN